MSIDWTPLFEKYKGKWLALKEDEITVIGVGSTPKEAWDKAQKEGYASPILTNIPDKIVTYIGYGDEISV
ncbi:MAG: DUF5678 domain-containing protein [Candidatus Woykebacteria bacterium]